jgi:serine/threonine-protein kinase 24/25/MST4
LNLVDEAMACEWHLKEVLGQGGFGTVYRARRVQPLMPSSASSSQTSRNVPAVVAMKCIDLEASEDDVSTISHEVLSLASTRSCPQLLDYYGCQVIHTSSLWLSMEYIEDGSIASQLKSHGPMVEELIAVIAREILLGLQYMAREGKIHRDIKPGNVLVDIGRAQIKLCDFGASKTLTETMAKANTLIGSPYYCAPEVLMRAEYDGRVDIWSLGVMLYECAMGYCPLAHVPPVQVMTRIVSSPTPSLQGCTSDAMRGEKFSENFVNFHKLCMMKDPRERATVQMLLRHDFIRKAKKLASIRAMFNDRRAARRQTS